MEKIMDNPQLSEGELALLKDYQGTNSFIRTLSEVHENKGELKEYQIKAFRSEVNKSRVIEKCDNTSLNLNEVCIFYDKDDDSRQRVTITQIREKAVQFYTEDKSQQAWMPSKAVSVRENEDGEYRIIELLSWFEKDDKFWKAVSQ